ncbi:unnamed protein product [Closterium sp. NIES-53]
MPTGAAFAEEMANGGAAEPSGDRSAQHDGAEVARLEGEVAALKKEMAVKVKHYENKLLTHSVINGALQLPVPSPAARLPSPPTLAPWPWQAENERLKEDLQRALEGAQGGGGGGGGGAGGRTLEEAEQELRELHEEFTRRLNAAEKGVHAFREECFGLRRLVEEQRQAAARMEGEMAERDAQLQQSERESEALRQAVEEREAVLARQRQDLVRMEADRDRLNANKQALEAAAQSADATRSAPNLHLHLHVLHQLSPQLTPITA